MKIIIKTLNNPIKHEKPITLPHEVETFCAEIEQELREEYIMSHAAMLHGLDFDLLGMTVCGTMVVLMYTDHINYVDTAGMDRRTITAELIGAVMNYQ